MIDRLLQMMCEKISEWLENQKQSNSSIRQLLQERIEKANPHRKLTAEETKRLKKLEGIADKLKRGENVQNRQLQAWLSEEEYEQLEYEWKEQLELRNELKDKPSNFINRMGQERVEHSLLGKSLHWFFVLLFGYRVFKQIENKEQLNDLGLLISEMFFAVVFLLFILFRFIYMKRRYKTALPSETSKIQLITAKFVHTSMYFVLNGIAISGLGIGTLFWLGYKDGSLIETTIWVHELLFSSILWLISIHILAAIYHRTQNDFVWSSMVPFLKEKIGQKSNG